MKQWVKMLGSKAEEKLPIFLQACRVASCHIHLQPSFLTALFETSEPYPYFWLPRGSAFMLVTIFMFQSTSKVNLL